MDTLPLAGAALNTETAVGVTAMAVALVFGYAAVAKLLHVRAFIAGFRNYRIVPDRTAPFAGGFLIAGEGAIAWAHLEGVGLKYIAPVTAVLLSVFLVMTVILLKSGEKRPCLCFGASSQDVIDIYGLVRVCLLLFAELTLCLHLTISESAKMGQVTDSLSVAAPAVALIAWCLSIPKLRRAWQIVRF
jgi:hypothetical protein